MEIMPLFEHQKNTIHFLATHDEAFITSCPGTGKTRSVIEHIRNIKHLGKTLVFAPKSILTPSWGKDIEKFAPELTYAIAYSHNREEAFRASVDIIITNHDAVKWIADRIDLVEGFHLLVNDESTAYKNPQSQRSKAMAAIATHFKNKILMSGTPNPQGIGDIWHQMKILDGGQRLGKSFWAFKNATHTQIIKGKYSEWVEKDGIQDAVYGLIADINIRHKLEDCISMPDKFVTDIEFELPPKLMAQYAVMKQQALLQLQSGDITAINAASLATKLLQIASGSVYSSDGTHVLDTERYELIADLVEAREQCVIAFNWEHQRDALKREFEKRGITYGVIDGTIDIHNRNVSVEKFQDGKLRVILAHPQSAGHGLTLTRGTTTIWSSPTYNAEHYTQFNRRIYRAGQTQRTETIHIAAANTLDLKAYQRLAGKLTRMNDLLELLTQ